MKMKTTTKLWLGILALMVLSPLGLILPAHFNAGSAWGEWGADEVGKQVGYVPRGLQKLSSFWNAPLPDYAFKGWEEKGIMHLNIAYIVSAVAGIALVVAVTLLLGKIMIKQDNGKEK